MHHPSAPYPPPHMPMYGMPPPPGYYPYAGGPPHSGAMPPMSKDSSLKIVLGRQLSSQPGGSSQQVTFSTLNNDVIPDKEFVKETERY